MSRYTRIQCQRKKRYESWGEAEKAQRGMRRVKKMVYVYRCAICGGCHLSDCKSAGPKKRYRRKGPGDRGRVRLSRYCE